jgi:hypothetical protein
MIKALTKIGIERIYFRIINTLYDKSIANITLYGEKLKPIPVKPGMRQG